MKKLLALVLAVMLVIAVVPMCVSARTLTAEEKALFELLRSEIVVKDGTFALPTSVVNQGENFVASLENALTPDQIAKIEAEVKAAMEEVKKADTGSASKWSKETKAAIVAHIDTAAKELGGSASMNAKGDVDVKDASGAVIVTNDKLVKTTGFGVEGVAIAGFCALTVLCACAFVSKKVELF